MNVKKIVLIAAGSLFALGLIGSLAGQSKTTSAQNGTVATTTTEPVLRAAEVTTTTETPTTTDPGPALMAAWAGTYGSPDAQTMADIDHAIGAAATAGDVDATTTACSAGLIKVHTIQGHPAAPDPALDLVWSKALSLEAQAMDACARGAATGDVSLIEQATEYTQQSTEALNQANAIIGRYTH